MGAFQHQIFGFGCGSALSFTGLSSGKMCLTTLKSNFQDYKMALEPLTYPHEITGKCLQTAQFSIDPYAHAPASHPQSSPSQLHCSLPLPWEKNKREKDAGMLPSSLPHALSPPHLLIITGISSAVFVCGFSPAPQTKRSKSLKPQGF